MPTLLSLPLRRKVDLLRARQSARRVASLLRFDAQEQACVAAGAFAVAEQAWQRSRAGQLCFQVEDATLHIFVQIDQLSSSNVMTDEVSTAPQSPLLRLAKPLPAAPSSLAPEDLSWVMQQLNRHLEFSVFEEIQRQNQEMLALLHALHIARTQLLHLGGKHSNPSAA